MTAGVLHALWLHGRNKPWKSCREILTTPFCPRTTPIDAANPQHKILFYDFLLTEEADENVGDVLNKYGASH